MTPKEFMLHFISSPNSDIAYLRRYWSTSTGIDGAIKLIEALRDAITRTNTGQDAWMQLIQKEVRHFDMVIFL
jgi:hypothetical protein